MSLFGLVLSPLWVSLVLVGVGTTLVMLLLSGDKWYTYPHTRLYITSLVVGVAMIIAGVGIFGYSEYAERTAFPYEEVQRSQVFAMRQECDHNDRRGPITLRNQHHGHYYPVRDGIHRWRHHTARRSRHTLHHRRGPPVCNSDRTGVPLNLDRGGPTRQRGAGCSAPAHSERLLPPGSARPAYARCRQGDL